MFTNIPIQDEFENVRGIMIAENFRHGPLNSHDINQLLLVILQNNYFHNNGRVFRQIAGLAMGNRVSGLLATLFMNTLEK